MTASGPPNRVLPPLTSSLLPSVAGALSRRRQPRDESAGHGGYAERGRDVFDGIGGAAEADEDSQPVEELPQVREARARERETREHLHGHRVSEGPRVFTLGELVETIRARKQRSRNIVQSGDVDGEETEIDEDDILNLSRPRRSRK